MTILLHRHWVLSVQYNCSWSVSLIPKHFLVHSIACGCFCRGSYLTTTRNLHFLHFHLSLIFRLFCCIFVSVRIGLSYSYCQPHLALQSLKFSKEHYSNSGELLSDLVRLFHCCVLWSAKSFGWFCLLSGLAMSKESSWTPTYVYPKMLVKIVRWNSEA